MLDCDLYNVVRCDLHEYRPLGAYSISDQSCRSRFLCCFSQPCDVLRLHSTLYDITYVAADIFREAFIIVLIYRVQRRSTLNSFKSLSLHTKLNFSLQSFSFHPASGRFMIVFSFDLTVTVEYFRFGIISFCLTNWKITQIEKRHFGGIQRKDVNLNKLKTRLKENKFVCFLCISWVVKFINFYTTSLKNSINFSILSEFNYHW